MPKCPTHSIRPILERLESREVPAGQVLATSAALLGSVSVQAGRASLAVSAAGAIQVEGAGKGGSLAASFSARVASAGVAPSAPIAFGATSLSTSQVRLAWTDAQREEGYRVYQWDGSSSWGEIGSLGAGATSYTVSGLAEGKKYYFYVEARNAYGTTPSAIRDVTTLILKPSVPGSFAAAALSGSQVRLTWADAQREDGYRIYQWNGASNWVVVGSAGAGATSHTVAGLAGGRDYYFYVEAFNSHGSSKTEFKKVTTSAPPPAPGSFTATAVSETQVRLNWSASAGAEGYRVYQWTGSAWANVGSAGAGATSHTVGGLSAGKTYYFYVEAFNANGAAKTSFQAVKTLGPSLTAPTSLTAMLVGSQVRLSWADGSGELGYRIRQWTGSGWAVIGTVGANLTSFDIAGLARMRTYYFTVEAYSATASATSTQLTVTIG